MGDGGICALGGLAADAGRVPGVVRVDGTDRMNHGDCTHCCPEGNPCTCKGTAHVLHVCDCENCECHTQARYKREAGRPAYTRITLRRGGIRVILDRGAPGGVGWVEVDRYVDAPSPN